MSGHHHGRHPRLARRSAGEVFNMASYRRWSSCEEALLTLDRTEDDAVVWLRDD